jgi:hypothetical protein
MNLTKDVDLKKIAEKMPVTSGAEVKAVCTEAGMFALRERRTHVNMEDFELAVAKVRGPGFGGMLTLGRLLPRWITRKLVYKSYGSRFLHLARVRRESKSVAIHLIDRSSLERLAVDYLCNDPNKPNFPTIKLVDGVHAL